jgi:branched-chain amino acid transport system ATP-binding protein
MSARLEVHSVTKRYGGLIVVDEVSFEVAEGTIVSLIGPNGAGKTTTMNLIAGSIKSWTGEIRFCGQSLRRLRPHAIARLGIARTFQVSQPFTDMSLVDNVLVGALFGRRDRLAMSAARSKAMALLESVGLAEQAQEPAETLNPAGRKRLELARALSTDPRLVLIDELMAGLNPTEVDAMVELVDGIRSGGISILMVEHVMRVVTSLADRVVVLDLGKKIAEGPAVDILHDERVIDAYLGRRGTRRELTQV